MKTCPGRAAWRGEVVLLWCKTHRMKTPRSYRSRALKNENTAESGAKNKNTNSGVFPHKMENTAPELQCKMISSKTVEQRVSSGSRRHLSKATVFAVCPTPCSVKNRLENSPRCMCHLAYYTLATNGTSSPNYKPCMSACLTDFTYWISEPKKKSEKYQKGRSHPVGPYKRKLNI